MVVAGDLIPRAERGVRWLLERVQDRPVVYVMGNHEAYGTDIQRTLEKAKAAAAGMNVHVLENETVRVGISRISRKNNRKRLSSPLVEVIETR